MSVTLLIIAAACTIAAGAKAWLSERPAAAVPAKLAPQSARAQEEPEVEAITLFPSGFEPREITRPRGKFLLMVNNRTGLEQIDWRLGREAGEKLHEVRLPSGRLSSKQYEDLPPGTYVLTEAAHPDWTCRITITPN